MFKTNLKKALAVIAAGTVIASSSFASMPVYAAVTPETSAITQAYSIANYDPDREFTVKRVGDVQAYSKKQLVMHFGANNRIPTGIWTAPGKKLKVYVKANSDDAIPKIMFTQHLTDGVSEVVRTLQRGVNEIEVPTVSASVESGFEVGGSIYLLNPYTEQQQSSDVRVYIEGGDKFPYFVKNGNVKEFVAKLRDYYNGYLYKEDGYHNIAEIWNDHLIITLSLERMYEAYVKNSVSPQVTAENMDKFIEDMLKFDNLEPSEYKNLNVHLKVTKMAPGVGAYAASNGVVAVPDDGWSAAAVKGEHMGWGYPHEFGHIFDNQTKVQAEVTNNVYSLKYVIGNELYADIAVGKPLSDVNLLSANETNDIYRTSPTGYTDVYMFWDLEVYHEGLNGKLDDMLRDNSCGDKTVDNYLASCDVKEKVAAYCSKITGVDLTYYFKKYGYVKTPSANYTNAVNSMNLSKSQPKIWYYDFDAYNRSKSSNINVIAKPSLSNYETSSKTMYFTVPVSAAENHLGFEIMKDGKFVAYVWDNKYSSSDLSGTYTVNAYDRSLAKYASFTVNTSDSSMTDKYVAKTGSASYRTLEEAINAAPDNSTVYLLESLSVKNPINISGKHITLMPADTKKQIVIYNGTAQQKNVFVLTNKASLTVTANKGADNTLVFDGQNKSGSLSYFRLTNSMLYLDKGVTVRNCSCTSEGSVAGAFDSSEIDLTGCLIEKNASTDNRGTFFLAHSILNSSDNTVIRYNRSRFSGSVIQAYYDNIIDIQDTQIYNNYNNDKDDCGTIRLLGSTLVLGNGAVIEDNQSDWYDLASAVLTDDSSNVEVWGKVDITDRISTSVPIELSSDMTGTLSVRPNYDYAKKDAVLFKPLQNTISKDQLKNINLVSNDFYLDYKNDTFYLSDTEPLINDSTFSGKNFIVGDTLKMYPAAHGGNGKYTYQYELNIYDENGVCDEGSIISMSPDKNVHEFEFTEKGTYGFTIMVKDSSGKTDFLKEHICTVYDKLVNNSTVSSKAVTLGNSITVKGSAKGGAGGYKYAVYYRKKSEKSWTKVQDYKSTTDSKITPRSANEYVIRVKAKDKLGNITNRDINVTVNEKLVNTSKISATAIDIGQTVNITASAKGGTAPFTYSVLYKKTSESKWTKKQDFTSNTAVSIKPSAVTTYDICVKVKDSQGTIEKQYFTLTVNKAVENKSTVSADTIKLGNSVTVKCNASGGSGFYNYAVYYKKESESKWTVKQTYSSNSNVVITPSTVTKYDICVKVKDNSNSEIKKYFKLTVTNADLYNNSKISAETIKVNGTVKITGIAAGGFSPYTYAFYYKEMNSSDWTKKQDFNSNSTVSVKFTKAGVYNICAKVKDSKGTIIKKYFTVTVEK